MRRYCPSHHHGLEVVDSVFRLFLAFASLAREMVSKLMSSFAYWLVRSHDQTGCSHVHTTTIPDCISCCLHNQCHSSSLLYHSMTSSCLQDLPFHRILTTLPSIWRYTVASYVCAWWITKSDAALVYCTWYDSYLDECLNKLEEIFHWEIFRNCQVNFTSIGNMSEVSMYHVSNVMCNVVHGTIYLITCKLKCMASGYQWCPMVLSVVLDDPMARSDDIIAWCNYTTNLGIRLLTAIWGNWLSIESAIWSGCTTSSNTHIVFKSATSSHYLWCH